MVKDKAFRFGQTHGRQLKENTPKAKLPLIFATTILKAAYCYISTILTIFNATKWRKTICAPFCILGH